MAVSSGSPTGLRGLVPARRELLLQLGHCLGQPGGQGWGSATGHLLPPLDGVKPAGPPACASVGVPEGLLAEVRAEFQAPSR